MVNVGVLALQGSVAEHLNSFSKIPGVNAVEIRTEDELNNISGLVVPGGESTAIGKLINDFGLKKPIVERIKSGMPVWGTCAGMILMAKEILDENYIHLGIMDIAVRRNAYGSQLDSFATKALISGISDEEIPLVFIRAPWVETVGDGAEVIAEVQGRIVAVKQDNMMVTSFHPELTDSLAFHKYFIRMVEGYCQN